MRILLTLLAVLSAVSAQAEPFTNTIIKFYDIYPKSKHDIAREMIKKSPVIENGKRYTAYTSWHVGWKYNEGVYKISEVSTTLNVTYTMPRIPETYKVSQKIRHPFAGYYDVLLEHEKGHMRSGLYEAREIEKALQKLGTFRSTKKLKESAKSTGMNIIRKYNVRDKRYDQETNHGNTQGVDINNFL